ncbi:MAG TPA: Uma2 family endonuclease [Terriglobia bacterium]|jgi:hypothetical protein
MSTDVITKKLFTVDEFQRMQEAGILEEDRRYELIRGEILELPRPGPPHAGRVKRLNRLFTSKLGEAAIVSVQDPVVLERYSAPIPDLALLRPKRDFYAERHPRPEDILLVVEVADSSLKWDSTVKAELYAETGISEYWLLDIHGDALIVHSGLKNGIYESVIARHRGEAISAQLLPAFLFTIDEILGD